MKFDKLANLYLENVAGSPGSSHNPGMTNKEIDKLKEESKESLFFYIEELTGGYGVKWDKAVEDWDNITDVYSLRDWVNSYINKEDRCFKMEEILFNCFELLGKK